MGYASTLCGYAARTGKYVSPVSFHPAPVIDHDRLCLALVKMQMLGSQACPRPGKTWTLLAAPSVASMLLGPQGSEMWPYRREWESHPQHTKYDSIGCVFAARADGAADHQLAWLSGRHQLGP